MGATASRLSWIPKVVTGFVVAAFYLLVGAKISERSRFLNFIHGGSRKKLEAKIEAGSKKLVVKVRRNVYVSQ